MSYVPITTPTDAKLLNSQLQTFATDPKFRQAAKSWAYYRMIAYDDRYGVSYDSPYVEWDITKYGPRPIVQPLGKVIVDSGAEFLFATGPTFLCPQNEAIKELIQSVIKMNALDEKLMSYARQAANEGSIWLTFAWTPQIKKRPIAIHVLSPWEVMAFRDTLDPDVIYKIRVQIKYSTESPQGNKQWWLYREEWTAEERVVYKALMTDENDDSRVVLAFNEGEWPIDYQELNPFKVIPFVQVYNRRLGTDTDGVGDLWDIYPILNQYNHTCWLEHRSNQWDVEAIIALLNADTSPNSINPGDLVKLFGEGVDIKRLTPENNMRQFVERSRLEWERNALDAAGADRMNYAEVTNMGDLTRTVMELLFNRSVKTCLEKRTYWGTQGLAVFFELMLEGLSQLPDAKFKYPALSSVDTDNPEDYCVEVRWPSLFRVTPAEGQSIMQNLTAALADGLIDRANAVRVASEVFGIQDVDALLQELKPVHDSLDAEREALSRQSVANADLAEKQAKAPINPPGGSNTAK